MSDSTGNKLVKNLLSITSGQVINLGLTFVSITLAARFLGVEDFGKFGYLLAIVAMISKVLDFGFSPIVFRELSINKNDYSLLNTALIIRLAAFVVVVALFNIVVYFIDFTGTEIILSNILLINSIISSKFICVRELLDVPFKVNLKMHYPMIFTNIDNFILLLIVLILPFVENKLSVFIIGYVVANIPGLILMIVFLKNKFNYKINFNLQSTKWLFVESLPIYGYIVLDALYQQLDVVFLKNFVNYHDAGIYAVSSRLVMPLLIFPTAIIHTIFPTISKNSSVKDSDDDTLIDFIFKVLFLFSFSLAIIFAFKAEPIIKIIYGTKYLAAGAPTSLLLFAQIFIFYSFFIINLMIVYKKQHLDFYYSILVLVVNVVANIILIPKLSFLGVGYAKLLTAFVGFLFTAYFLYDRNKKVYLFNRYVIVWAVFYFVVLYFISFLNLYLFLGLSIIILVVSVLLMKYFSDKEILFLFNILRKPAIGEKIIKLKLFKY